MTRVNADLNPAKLKRMHLLAELREITMVPASLRRSLRTRTKSQVLASVPGEFTLNRGHVTFFYDKLFFLRRRFLRLCREMVRRGYTPDYSRVAAFDGFDDDFYQDWTATPRDLKLISERIALRISERPHLYKD